jgi:hypothetical protein
MRSAGRLRERGSARNPRLRGHEAESIPRRATPKPLFPRPRLLLGPDSLGSGAGTFRMQATTLGQYLLYGGPGSYLGAGPRTESAPSVRGRRVRFVGVAARESRRQLLSDVCAAGLGF